MNKFRFAIMGAGNIAVRFCGAVKRMECCEVAAVASKSMERAASFAGKYGIDRFYDSYEEMLLEEKPDCVYIATTPDSHYALAKLCMKHRTPVLCEKAMFMTSEQAKDVFAESEKNGVFAMEAMWSRFLPANITAKQWMQEGKIGMPNCISVTCGWAFDREKDRRNFAPELGGGAAFDLTVYNYELATWFFGTEILEKQIVTMWDAFGVDMFNQITLKYQDRLAVLLAGCESVVQEGIVLSGTKGRIVVPHAHYGAEVFLYDRSGSLVEHYMDTVTENGFIYEIAEVVECIRNGKTESETVPHKDTIACAELFDEIYKQQEKI